MLISVEEFCVCVHDAHGSVHCPVFVWFGRQNNTGLTTSIDEDFFLFHFLGTAAHRMPDSYVNHSEFHREMGLHFCPGFYWPPSLPSFTSPQEFPNKLLASEQ